jgi:hypothetical protein
MGVTQAGLSRYLNRKYGECFILIFFKELAGLQPCPIMLEG